MMDDVDLDIPPRSILLPVEPIGIGTAQCEGLVSYVTRLAYAHRVSAQGIFRLALRDFLVARDDDGGYQYGYSALQFQMRLEGTAPRGQDLAARMEELTGRKNLRLLTMKSVFDIHGLKGYVQRNHPAWCVECLRDDLAARGQAYFRLAWSCSVYSGCHLHGCPLTDQCPACGKRQRAVRRTPDQTVCTECHQSLLGARRGYPGEYSADELDRWKSEVINKMLVARAPDAPIRSRARFFDEIEKARIEKGTNSKDFGPELRVSIDDYRNMTKARTPLTRLLAVGRSFRLTPHELVVGPVTDILSRTQDTVDLGYRTTLKRDWPTVQQSFVELLETESNISLKECGRRLGVSPSTLWEHFPEHCEHIADRFRTALAEKKRYLAENGEAVVREITRDVFSSGVEPKWANVRARLPSYLELKARREPELKSAWLDECVELGYAPRLCGTMGKPRHRHRY